VLTDSAAPIVHVVDDDAPTRDATARFLRAAGYVVRTYGTATEFLRASPIRASGCVVLDLALPGLNGFDVLQALSESEHPLPVVFLSGLGDVHDSVRAMKSGAVDFLTKTEDGSHLLEAVSRALARDAGERARLSRVRELRARYERLSPREREVLAHLISGQLNKQIGFDLGISVQTTKLHRHRVLEKMQADSIAHLVRMAAELGVAPVGSIR
jgi:two-component system, LuxR family, response regulator FixJ